MAKKMAANYYRQKYRLGQNESYQRYSVCLIAGFCFLILLLLGACSTVSRQKDARNIALSAGFTQRQIAATPFMLTSFERVRSRGREAHVYIEGDGLAWVGKRTPSLDPTPKDPVALKLATRDPASNVIYIARPCQYSKLIQEGGCPQKYWTSHRFAPEVINAMNTALDDIKKRNDLTGVHLIGYSGGANVAVLLAAQRRDVLSLRTVAGNLDHVLLHKNHGVSQMPFSLNAKDVAQKVSDIPQYHFIGAEDEVVPPLLALSFIRASGKINCIQSEAVPNVSHGKGWENVWTSLLKRTVMCK